MTYLIKIVSAFFAAYFFSILFNTHKKELMYSGLLGAVSWGIYMFTMELFTWQPEVSSFLAALVVGILACQLAKWRKAPVTVFLVAGIIPLVPGAGMYRTMRALISNNYNGTVMHLIETLQAAGAIAIALGFSLSILIRRSHKNAVSGKKA